MSKVVDHWGDTRFADHVSREALNRGNASLAELNGQPIAEPNKLRSSLVEKWETAWVKPLNRLTCGEVRTLVGQGDGLPWLARALAEFVSKHSEAEIDFYPGDLTIAVLRLYDEIKSADKIAARRIANTNLSWMLESDSLNRSLRREAERLIANANA